MPEPFSVTKYFPGGVYERVDHRVPLDVAIRRAFSVTRSVGGLIGTTRRVIITDSGEIITWEWIHGKGLVFPLEYRGNPVIDPDYQPAPAAGAEP